MRRRTVIRVLLATALAEIAGPSVVAQAGVPAAVQDAQPTFRSAVEVVTVAVAVRDRRNRVVRDLKRSDFEVFDSGAPTTIRDFYSGDSPISLAILLDISGSMAMGGNMSRAREAVGVATMNLRAAEDEVALFTFDSKLREVMDFTGDLHRVSALNLEGTPWGVTSLFDAIEATARKVGDRANRHRAVLVISDGVDTASTLTAPQVSGIASAIDVPVYLLTVVNPLDHPGGEFEVLQAADKKAGSASLSDLARWTGGDIRFASVPAHTSEAVRDLFSELRFQYLITFEPGARAGWHPIEIRTRKKNLVVHARSGYLSGPSQRGT